MHQHQKDLAVQGKHGVEYLHYWLNEADGTVFCLCQAPNKEAAEAVHREAHGGGADEIIEVKGRRSVSLCRPLLNVPLTPLLFCDGILSSLLRRVSLAKSTSVPVRF
jgi:hypothetical protein